MFAYIQGTVFEKEPHALIVVTHGIGYQVFVPETLIETCEKGADIQLYVYHVVRETAAELYGFQTREGLRFFELLLSVSGVGPRTALSVMTLASLEKMKAAIAQGDAGLLKTVSGIGSKTAERIVVELKDKVGYSGTTPLHDEKDLIDALVSLGYSGQDARDALFSLSPQEEQNEQARLKAALKILGKK